MQSFLQDKTFVDSSDIVFSEKSIDHKIKKIEKDSEVENINVGNDPDNKGNSNNIGCNQVKDNTSLQSKLPKIVDVISELKGLISSHGQMPKLGKLLRLPATTTNSMLSNSKQEQKVKIF